MIGLSSFMIDSGSRGDVVNIYINYSKVIAHIFMYLFKLNIFMSLKMFPVSSQDPTRATLFPSGGSMELV